MTEVIADERRIPMTMRKIGAAVLSAMAVAMSDVAFAE